jgi:hypothetical protein
MLLAVYFVMVIALPLALGGYVVYTGLPRTRRCPACAGDTVRLRSGLHRLAGHLVHAEELHLRWCPECHWSGTVRLARTPAVALATARDIKRADRPARGGRAPDSVDIRRLDVDGRAVRVMVQCWAERGEWLGRLLFIAPDGRTWVEGVSSITGRSALDVLSQALTIPDGALTGRLRNAMR